jgi:hypothetical protein
MFSASRSRTFTVTLVLVAGALSGCAATADLSYGEYQFGPGYGSEQVYESRVYGDTQEGIGSEVCRGSVRRQVNEFGETIVRDDRVCN